MEQILEIFKSNLSITIYIGCLSSIWFISIFSENIKNNVRWLVFSKRTRKQSIITLFAFAVIFIMFDRREEIGVGWMLGSYISLFIIMIQMWLFTFCKTPLFALFHNIYFKYLKTGFTIEHFDEIRKKPWFVLTTRDNYFYVLLYERYCVELHRAIDACLILKECLKSALLTSERENINAALGRTYWGLGSYNTARDIIESLKKPSVTELSILGVIYEEFGETEKASTILTQLKENIEKNNYNEVETGVFYNNYGRRCLLCGNYIEAVSFFERATEIAKKLQNLDILNCSFINVVMCLLRSGDYQKATQYYNDYLKYFEEKNIGKQQTIELLNFKLTYAKQTKNLELIEKLFKEIKSQKENYEIIDRINLWVSALCISADLQMDLQWILSDISDDIENLFSLEERLRLRFCKDIYFTFQKVILPPGSKFILLKQRVYEYMNVQAVNDLELLKKELPVYAVWSYGEYVKEETFLKSEIIGNYGFEKVKKNYLDLAEFYEKNGLKFTAFNSKLEIINMAYIPKNIISISENEIPRTKFDTELKQIFNDIYEESKLYSAHPGMIFASIQLSTFAFHFGEKEKGREMYEFFDNMNISELLLNERMQGQVSWIRSNLSGKENI